MLTGDELPKQRTINLLLAPRAATTPSMKINHEAIQERAARLSHMADTTPLCLSCWNDDNLVYPEYREQRTLPDGRIESAWVRYCCTRCGAGRQHSVPVSWRPPGWFWCT